MYTEQGIIKFLTRRDFSDIGEENEGYKNKYKLVDRNFDRDVFVVTTDDERIEVTKKKGVKRICGVYGWEFEKIN